MSSVYDQFAKRLMRFRLVRFGHADTEYEVTGAVQKVDIWYRPDPARLAANADQRAELGPLAALLDTACMIEPFHHTPTPAEVLSCFRKQHNLAHALALDAGQAPASRLPDLWILSAGFPRQAIAKYGFCRAPPASGFPKGFWHLPAPSTDGRNDSNADFRLGFPPVYMIVISELPRTRKTLPLRLMGAGKTLMQAYDELRALPAADRERQLVTRAWILLRNTLPGELDLTEEDMRHVEQLDKFYEDWEREVLALGAEQGLERGTWRGLKRGMKRGMKHGLHQGLREGLVATFEARFGTMPAELGQALAQIRATDTLRGLNAVFATKSRDVIVDAVIDAARLADPGSPES